jgi:hypothetical protein
MTTTGVEYANGWATLKLTAILAAALISSTSGAWAAACLDTKIRSIHTRLSDQEKGADFVEAGGVAENLFLWINTKPAPHNVGQFALTATDHGALTHDCFLDCSRVTTFAEELGSARHRGPISEALAARIVELLTEKPPKTLPGKHLKLIIASL